MGEFFFQQIVNLKYSNMVELEPRKKLWKLEFSKNSGKSKHLTRS